MREIGLAILLLWATACASQPGRDGPARPTTSDTVRYPGDADDPLDYPACAGRRNGLDPRGIDDLRHAAGVRPVKFPPLASPRPRPTFQ